MKIKLTQQSVNFLIQFLSQPGWVTTTAQAYIAGVILVEKLPEPDLTWVKSDAERQRFTTEERIAYQAQDVAWCRQEIVVDLNDKEREVVRACLTKFISAMPITLHTIVLLREFGLCE